jgi:hypothetical protein
MLCFSGLNLIRAASGDLGIVANAPISGGGDIGFFPVRPDTFFVHDRRFERFHRGSLQRRFAGFLYWHLKYLKPDLGLANFELDARPDSRYARHLRRLAEKAKEIVSLRDLPARLQPRALDRLEALLSAKKRLNLERDAAVVTTFPDLTVLDAVQRTSDKQWVNRVMAL